MAPTTPCAPVPLPGGFSWQQRHAPDPALFTAWRTALDIVGTPNIQPAAPDGGWTPESLRDATDRENRTRRAAVARERMALLAAYDGGWDVRAANGHALESPVRLSPDDWNRVPRDVIDALLEHLDQLAAAAVAESAQQHADPREAAHVA